LVQFLWINKVSVHYYVLNDLGKSNKMGLPFPFLAVNLSKYEIHCPNDRDSIREEVVSHHKVSTR